MFYVVFSHSVNSNEVILSTKLKIRKKKCQENWRIGSDASPVCNLKLESQKPAQVEVDNRVMLKTIG